MKTYQDLLEIGSSDTERMDFIKKCIRDHENSDIYRTASIAYEYDKHRNVTINGYRKLLYTMTGKAVPDNYSSNWKMASGFFHRFVTQQVQYLLGNGVTWYNKSTNDALGDDFDIMLQKAARDALVGAVSFGFFNFDHLEVFPILQFVPLYDEENSALRAGIRYWQIDRKKPLRATFYEEDGYTEYIWRKSRGEVYKAKRPYIIKYKGTEADGTKPYDFENYPSFPIVPLWGNQYHQSKLVGLREQIDCYDFVKSGFANDVDDASQIYWIVQNAQGMDDVDLAKFLERLKVVHAAVVDDHGAHAESHTLEIPTVARETLLNRLEKDIYKDAMALNTYDIANGAVNTTQIKAAYEPLNSITDDFEHCVTKFLLKLLELAGIKNEKPTYTRSILLNTEETIEKLNESSSYLSSDYITEKILTLLGDGDKADEVLEGVHEEQLDRIEAGEE